MEVKPVSDLKRECHNQMMKETEDPCPFVIAMGNGKRELADLGHEIPETAFVQDTLSMLPENDEKKDVNPHQAEKRMLEEEADHGQPSLSNLMRKLQKLHSEHCEPEEDSDEESREEKKAHFSGAKQFKGRCHNCGVFGHKSQDCAEKDSDQNQQGRGSNQSHSNGGHRNNGRNNGSRTPRFNGKCHHCGKKGHKKADCWTLHGQPEEN